ncbi:ethanolamine ammonia-lyase light chain [Arcicella aurantiaca]|uniref:Ethanolamine ammonia-lyase small subunit n=1 Tax=Arcicella aurantiaca TaxID=591202 RepID=A0A316EGH6_9BACT|nr:ethanolamine ammonia-lyase subunit EutC [Arcicella aurantiaca]PWK28808.1 ethanolamine ammonia-lyase light chain [Arcicella aurantiaca]
MQVDHWQFLQNYTPARIARGRAGHSFPTNELLKFQADHAQARDAVYSTLNIPALSESLQLTLDLPIIHLKSGIENRSQYLQRPDLGRTLSQESREVLQTMKAEESDVCFVVTDGLSAEAINQNIGSVLENIIAKLNKINWKIASICLVEQGRVAVADEIGYLLKSKIVVVFIGERPGLTSPNSMGAYITFNPQVGITDESRNCVSNIRPEGMNPETASDKIIYLLNEMKVKKISGVHLKDEANDSKYLN